MAKSNNKPAYSVHIDNYKEFREEIDRFAARQYNALIVLGNTGIGKSETVKEKINKYLIYEGCQPTAFQFYCDLSEHIDEFVILDDVSPRFFKDNQTNGYLKALMNTNPPKVLQWPTSTLDDSTDVPNQFQTNSRVVILTNEWESINEHIRAIEGRAQSIVFEPSVTEVHYEVGRRGWFKDQDVYNFIWQHRYLITVPDMRLYSRIAEQKNAGAPWEKRGLEMLIGDKTMRHVAELLDDPRLTSNKQRCREFIARGYGGRSKFYERMRYYQNYQQLKGDKTPCPLLTDLRPEPRHPWRKKIKIRSSKLKWTSKTSRNDENT